MLRVHRRECVACEARSIRKTLIGCNGTQTATPATVDWDGVTVTECCHAVLMRTSPPRPARHTNRTPGSSRATWE